MKILPQFQQLNTVKDIVFQFECPPQYGILVLHRDSSANEGVEPCQTTADLWPTHSTN